MASFYADENVPRRTVEALRALDHDVLTTQDAGNAGQALPDHEVLDFATRAGRAVLTLNRRDFIRLHKRGIPHAGIVVCTEDPDCVRQAARIHEAVTSLPSLAGNLVRVNQTVEGVTFASTARDGARRMFTGQPGEAADRSSLICDDLRSVAGIHGQIRTCTQR